MAHDRDPPEGYLLSFRPNVTYAKNGFVAKPRAEPLTAEEVMRLETQWRERLAAGELRGKEPGK